MSKDINVLWARGNRGSYDHGLLMHALRGDMWPIPVTFRDTPGMVPELPGGAVVVFAGRHMGTEDGVRYLRAGMDKLPWTLAFHLGDEEVCFPSEQLRYPARRIVLQCANPYIPIRGDRNIALGWPEDARAWLKQCARKAASGRLLWSFAGQNNHAVRESMFFELRKRQPEICNLFESEGFGQGMGREAYYTMMADSCIVPCPTGNFSPETFRMYEALEAGCIPIPNRRAPNGGWAPGFNYWAWRYPDGAPFPTVENWSEVHAILDMYRDDSALLQRDMTQCLAWWSGQKREFALDLVRDCRELGAEVPVPPISVIVTASPVPSHPSLEIIEDSIRRIRSYPELRNAEILVGLDGVRPEMEHRRDAYEEFKRVFVDRCNWDPAFFGVLPVISDTWIHQAELTKRLLPLVRSPLILFVEHDTYPMGEIPWGGLVNCFRDETINYIRLHIFDSVIDEHKPLYGQRQERLGVPLMETKQYSQRPHLARTSWYREVMRKWFEDAPPSFIEDRIHGVAQEGHIGKMLIYSPDGSMMRSGTSDGRKDDAKAPS